MKIAEGNIEKFVPMLKLFTQTLTIRMKIRKRLILILVEILKKRHLFKIKMKLRKCL